MMVGRFLVALTVGLAAAFGPVPQSSPQLGGTLSVRAADAAPAKKGRKKKSRRGRRRRRETPPPAAPAAAPEAPPVPLPARGPTRIDFDDRLVEGQTNQSGAVVLFARKATGLKSMVDRRKSFRERTIRTIFDR